MKKSGFQQSISAIRKKPPRPYTVDVSASWWFWRVPAIQMPTSGWKLHVSLSLKELNARVSELIRLLCSRAIAAFKHPSSLEQARQINSGIPDPSQVGKIFTLYLQCEENVDDIVDDLQSWIGVGGGPALVSDVWVEPGGRLGLRYGSFDRRLYLDPVGRVRPGLLLPNGDLVEDYRSIDRSQLSVASRVPSSRVLALCDGFSFSPIIIDHQVFHPLARVDSSPKGRLEYAIQGSPPFDRVIIKTALRGISCSADGLDAQDLLERESAIRKGLEKSGFSACRTVCYERGASESKLATIDVGGNPISCLPISLRKRFVPKIIQEIDKLHRQGIVHRDIKPENILVVEDDLIQIIDFEIASFVDEASPPRAHTPGFCLDEDIEKASVGRDYFALARACCELTPKTPDSSPFSRR